MQHIVLLCTATWQLLSIEAEESIKSDVFPLEPWHHEAGAGADEHEEVA